MPDSFVTPWAVCSLPGFSVHGIFQARTLEWVAISFSRALPDPGIKPLSLALQADSLPLSHLRSPSFISPSLYWAKLVSTFAYMLSSLPKSLISLFCVLGQFFSPIYNMSRFLDSFCLCFQNFFGQNIYFGMFVFENWIRQGIVDLGFCTAAQSPSGFDWIHKQSWWTYLQDIRVPSLLLRPTMRLALPKINF